MNYKTSNLLAKTNSKASTKLSNGIVVHKQVDLDALGLSSYKIYFQKLDQTRNTPNSDSPFAAASESQQVSESSNSNSSHRSASESPEKSADLNSYSSSQSASESVQTNVPTNYNSTSPLVTEIVLDPEVSNSKVFFTSVTGLDINDRKKANDFFRASSHVYIRNY